MPFVKLCGKNIYYTKKGKGKTLILLHNGFYSSMTWDGIRDKLAKHFTVIDYDRFGYGRSEKLVKMDIDIIEAGVKELEELVSKLELKEFYLLGHCLGGAVAALYAERHQDKVKKLIAESVGYYGDHKLLVKSDWTFRKFEAIDRYLQKSLKKMHGEGYSKQFWELIRDYKLTYIMSDQYSILDNIKNIKCPVFVINGDRDFYFDVDHAVKGYRKFKNARLWIIPDCGHDAHREHEKDFVKKTIEFLNSKKTY